MTDLDPTGEGECVTRQRVWLSSWEWACCGEPFTLGDEVSFSVSRAADSELASLLGAEMAAGIDAVESHHDDPGGEHLAGVVRGISVVAVPHLTRRAKREPQRRGDLELPAPKIGDGYVLAFGSRSEYTTTSEPIPGTPTVTPTTRVPHPPTPASTEALPDGPMDDTVENLIVGYLVEIDALV